MREAQKDKCKKKKKQKTPQNKTNKYNIYLSPNKYINYENV